jgi:translation initiation factor 4G
VLNKLTKDTFGTLSKQLVDIMKVQITDPEVLKGVINTIFEKALGEPSFCTMYAELCRILEKNCPPFESEKKEGKPQTFKRFLLNRCQEEFEQKPPADHAAAALEQEAKKKDRMIGSTCFRFILSVLISGHLYRYCVYWRIVQGKDAH